MVQLYASSIRFNIGITQRFNFFQEIISDACQCVDYRASIRMAKARLTRSDHSSAS